MAVEQLNRLALGVVFSNGNAPDEDNFRSIFLSTLNKTDDGVQVNVNGNLELKGGIRLNAAAATEAGTLRFAGTSLQYHDGTGYQTLSTGSAGAFLPIGTSQDVAFQTGSVGIGAFDTTRTPNRLDVVLGPNTGISERVKLGNLIIHNGSGTPTNPDGAYIGHSSLAGNPAQYALFQDSQGNTAINTAIISSQLTLNQGGEARIRLNNAGAIELIPRVGADVLVGNPFARKDLVIAGNLRIISGGNATISGALNVTGNTTMAGTLNVTGIITGTVMPVSDNRLKKDIQPFADGFEKILTLNPVKFRYNGKAGTPTDDKERVGFIAQDLQAVFPELVVSQSRKLNEEDPEETEVLTYDPGPLTFVLINAIKEIALRLNNLEKNGINEKRKPRNQTGINS